VRSSGTSPASLQTKYFLAVESYENWKFDRTNGFSFLGISQRYAKRAATVKKGDIIVMYVSKPKSAFSDVRRVIADGTYHERRASDYQSPLSIAIKTETFVCPPIERWLDYRTIGPKLSFVGNPPRNSAMRQSFRSLTAGDAKILLNGLKGELASI
jgi:hypothetical protein